MLLASMHGEPAWSRKSPFTAPEAGSFMALDSIDRWDGHVQHRPFTAAADLSIDLVDAALGGYICPLGADTSAAGIATT